MIWGRSSPQFFRGASGLAFHWESRKTFTQISSVKNVKKRESTMQLEEEEGEEEEEEEDNEEEFI